MKSPLAGYRFLLMGLVANLISLIGISQEIPIGTWRTHLSFNTVTGVALAGQTVYAAGTAGVLSYDHANKELHVLHKGNSLSNAAVKTIAYDKSRNQLLVAYENGTFDIIKDQRIRTFDPARNTVITGSKAINHIRLSGSSAYFSTDYGVLVFDLDRSEIRETWRDLGPSGSGLSIYQSAFVADSVFLLTANGLMAGKLTDNLLDFAKWRRFTASPAPGSANRIEALGSTLFIAFEEEGVYRYVDGQWSAEPELGARTYRSLNASNGVLVITDGKSVWSFNPDAGRSELYVSDSATINEAIVDGNGVLWLADQNAGLVMVSSGTSATLMPNGPATNEVAGMALENDRLITWPRGFSADRRPLRQKGEISIFQGGVWSTEMLPVQDITSRVASNGKSYTSSFGWGIYRHDPASVIDETNSTLINLDPPERNVYVTSMASGEDGLWVANYGASLPLQLYKSEVWEGFSFPYSAARYPLEIHSDWFGNVWMVLDPLYGGGMVAFNRKSNQHVLITSQIGQGALPSNRVNAIVNDRDGNVWVGTDAGVAYFFDRNTDAVKPIFENRFLLRDDNITAIAVDGGNRKWIGTDRGVWLFNPTGERALMNFTAANSPLLSDHVTAIQIHPVSGEVFFGTTRGIVSYRSNSSAGHEGFRSVKIFPNPVAMGWNGNVGITGLTTDAIVKITDVSGRLVRQTTANGGTASWDVRDHRGSRVTTGIYLVLVVSADGTESVVGKIAVVN